MTTAQRAALIGTPVLITVGKMRFRAKIIEAQRQFGNERVLVEPAAGDGKGWVNLDGVTLLRKGGA